MLEADAIVYICTYYDSSSRTQNIYCRHCRELLLPRCTKHSLIPFVCVLSDIFYLNFASVLEDVSRPVMINNIPVYMKTRASLITYILTVLCAGNSSV